MSVPVRKDSKPVLLIDSSNLTHAAFHTMGSLQYNSRDTGVIYGYLKNILGLAEKFKTNDIMTFWDQHQSKREEVYPEYKKSRKEKKEELSEEEKIAYSSLNKQSIDLLNEVLPRMGFRNNYIHRGYEADDLMAHWVKRLHRRGNRIIMVTSDADMYQCLNMCDIYSTIKKKLFTKNNLISDFGIEPCQWALAKAIGGCDSDGVIGIEGVADPKKQTSKALKYLQHKLPNGKVKQKIESKKGRRIIKRNLPVVTLPFREDEMKKMIKRRNKYSRKSFIQVFTSYGFVSFLSVKEFKRWDEAFLQ
jgi:5'-3' exonuclease